MAEELAIPELHRIVLDYATASNFPRYNEIDIWCGINCTGWYSINAVGLSWQLLFVEEVDAIMFSLRFG